MENEKVNILNSIESENIEEVLAETETIENKSDSDDSLDNKWSQVSFFMSMIPSSFAVTLSRLGHVFVNSIGLSEADRIKGPVYTSGIGIILLVQCLLMFPLSFGPIESVGIYASYAFGEHNYNTVKSLLFKGFIAIGINLLLLYLTVISNIESILLFLDVDVEVSRMIGEFMKYSFINESVHIIRSYLIVYNLSQYRTTWFGMMSVVSMVVSIPLTYYLCRIDSVGVYGWVIGKFVFEMMMLVMVLVYSYTENKVGSIDMYHIKDALKGFGSFYIESMYYSAIILGESMGTEISMYMCTQLHRVEYTSAYSKFINISSMVYQIGNGLTLNTRSILNHSLGSREVSKAKKMYKVITTGLIIVSFVVGALIYSLSEVISTYYTHEDGKERLLLVRLLKIYGLFLPYGWMLYPYTFTMARMMKFTNVLMILEVVLLIIVHFVIDRLLISYVIDVSCIHLMIVLHSLMVIIHTVLLPTIWLSDWYAIFV